MFPLVVSFAVSSAHSSGILHVSFMEDYCVRSLIAFMQLVSTVVSGALSTCVLCGTIRSLPFHMRDFKKYETECPAVVSVGLAVLS